MSLSTYLFRKHCEKSDKKRDEGLTIPDGVEYIRDIRYGRNKKYHTLDICWPVGGEKLPVIISVHGGAYVYGTKEVYQFYAASLAEKGFAVINFNYRLAPEYHFPAPLEDLTLVIKWLIANKEDYPVDIDNVFLVGDSAGAQIVSQYGAIYSNKEYRKIMDFRKPKINIRALGFCCGTYDINKNLAENGCKGALRAYFTSKPERFGEQLNVLDYIDDEYPPVYMFSSKGDFLVNECEIMAEFLKRRGVKCKYKIYGNKNTGHVFHVNMSDKYGAEANEDQTEFFKKYVRKFF